MSRRTDTRQPALALVPRSREPVGDAGRAAAARRSRIGPAGEEMWLEWRAERAEYAVAWYDRAARTRRRKQIGIGPGEGNDPPREAFEALAAHFAARTRPAQPQQPADVGLSTILTSYLTEHCRPEDPAAGIAAPERQAYAVLSIERYLDHRRQRAGGGRLVTIADLGREFLADFSRFRRADSVADSTIKRELSVLRAAVHWAADGEIIATLPHLPKLRGADELKTRGRKLAYTLPQVAAILEAAWSEPRRQHIHLFAITMLASHARTEAILECDLDLQYADDVIDWLGPDREQTSKRRSITPVGPTLTSWLEKRSGKLIKFRAEKAKRHWADPDVPEFLERPTLSIDTAFEKTLIAAGQAHPSLRLALPVLGPDGDQQVRLVKEPGKQGRGAAHEEPVWRGMGSPNTFRHTVHTQLRRVGVPKGQIDAASGHRDPGTGGHYDHLDAKHDMKDLVDGIEQVFSDLAQFTKVHLRSQCGPKVIDMGAVRARKEA
jgi:integrase